MGARFSQESDPTTQEGHQKPSGPEGRLGSRKRERARERARENRVEELHHFYATAKSYSL